MDLKNLSNSKKDDTTQNCPKCGVPMKGDKCDYCGYTKGDEVEEEAVKQKNSKKRIILCVIGAFVVLSIIASISNSCDKKEQIKAEKQEKKDKEKEYQKLGKITWPSSGMAALLPKPEDILDKKGEIEYDSSDSFYCHFYEVDKKDFDNYADLCKSNGFDVDYNKSDSIFTAKNSEGIVVRLDFDEEDYEYDKTCLSIHIEKPTEEVEENKTEKKPQEQTQQSQNNNTQSSQQSQTDASFRQLMDEYEKWVDGYVAFMNKYKANPSDMGLLSEYTKWVSQYSDWSSKVDAYDESNLSASDLAYYTEVMTRCAQKLAGVQ